MKLPVWYRNCSPVSKVQMIWLCWWWFRWMGEWLKESMRWDGLWKKVKWWNVCSTIMKLISTKHTSLVFYHWFGCSLCEKKRRYDLMECINAIESLVVLYICTVLCFTSTRLQITPLWWSWSLMVLLILLGQLHRRNGTLLCKWN